MQIQTKTHQMRKGGNGKFFPIFFVLRNYFSAVPCESALRVINREQEEKKKRKKVRKNKQNL